MIRTAVFLALLRIFLPDVLGSQEVPIDSVPALTRTLSAGSLGERAQAAWSLQRLGLSELPEPSRRAVLKEFERLNDLMRADQEIPGIEELAGEDFGEYYGALAGFVYDMDGSDAVRALARSGGGGVGLLQKAAEAGDEIIPLLAERIRDDYAAGDALETMGYAWFWADSAGGQLSEQSRRTIVEHLLRAATLVPSDPAVALALENTRDPAFLGMARAMEADPRKIDARMFLRQFTIPVLEAEAATRSEPDLVAGASRSLAVICSGVVSGRKQGACRSLGMELEAARRHLEAGRAQPARNLLRSYLKNAENAQRAGAIDQQEMLLVTGPITYLLQ